MSTRTATPLPRRSEDQNHRAGDTRDRGPSGSDRRVGPAGVVGKRARCVRRN